MKTIVSEKYMAYFQNPETARVTFRSIVVLVIEESPNPSVTSASIPEHLRVLLSAIQNKI